MMILRMMVNQIVKVTFYTCWQGYCKYWGMSVERGVCYRVKKRIGYALVKLIMILKISFRHNKGIKSLKRGSRRVQT